VKNLIAYALNLFVFWIVTVGYGLQFDGLTGDYYLDVLINGLLWAVVNLVLSFVVILVPAIGAALIGILIGNEKTAAGCACVSVIISYCASAVIGIWLLMNLHQWIDFFPQYTLVQALIIEVITTIITLMFGSSKSK
jgi:hypothetical protein